MIELQRTNVLDFFVFCFRNMGTCFVYSTVVLGQPAGLSEKVCLLAGAADWLICRSDGGERTILPMTMHGIS